MVEAFFGVFFFFLLNDPPPPEFSPFPPPAPLLIKGPTTPPPHRQKRDGFPPPPRRSAGCCPGRHSSCARESLKPLFPAVAQPVQHVRQFFEGSKDRKSTRLNSSHGYISYAVFCLKKKKTTATHE